MRPSLHVPGDSRKHSSYAVAVQSIVTFEQVGRAEGRGGRSYTHRVSVIVTNFLSFHSTDPARLLGLFE